MLLSAAFVISGLAVVFFAYLTVQHILQQPLSAVDIVGEELAGGGITSISQNSLAPVPTAVMQQLAPTAEPTPAGWDGNERVNILLMGIDRRPGEAFVSRTDSMMIISIDPANEKASVLSLPRDLYVEIPGYGQDRINTALVYGARNGDYLSGAALSMQTVAYNLDIPIDHFVLVDFGAFTRAIDILGGIDVQVPYTINDPEYPDMNYGYDPLFIPAGLQHFDGAMALKYARTRHADSDFNRATRQQQVLMAARQKALSLGVAELLLRAPSLYRELEQGIRTDLSPDQLLRLAKTASDIPSENIASGVLDQNYVTSYRTPAGASVLLLQRDIAMPFIYNLFSN